MILLKLALAISLFFGCSPSKVKDSSHSPEKANNSENSIIVDSILANLIADQKLEGAITIYDPVTNQWITNNSAWLNYESLPASTFKIVNSIIGLETDVIQDSTIFYWDGQPRYLDTWEQDLSLRQAFQYSCVPCYQQVARDIGVERMNQYIKLFHYGDMQVDSTTIDSFWLQGDSKITPKQQIEFLEKLVNQSLPIQESTYEEMRKLMILEENQIYKLYGKTGLSIQDNQRTGWFVGYIITPDQPYYFATILQPTEDFDYSQFAAIRAKITKQALEKLGITPTDEISPN